MNFTNPLLKALQCQNEGCPPVWMMRQAGRYHTHYQSLRKKYPFEVLCKDPALACEVALGPIIDFDFDAAILFSDILFPLEAIGMPLRFDPGPKLENKINEHTNLDRFCWDESFFRKHMGFQQKALEILRDQLAPHKSVLGFIGGPYTVARYAHTEHQAVVSQLFLSKITSLLRVNMEIQAQVSPDAICIFDTQAKEHVDFNFYINNILKPMLSDFKILFPTINVIYYTKGLTLGDLKSLEQLPLSAIGIDSNISLTSAFECRPKKMALQGNVDPYWLTLDEALFKKHMDAYLNTAKGLSKVDRSAWIAGLGHGVTPQARESNVRLFVKKIREVFA